MLNFTPENGSPRMDEKDLRAMSPAALSFVGDGVFELYVRMFTLQKGNRTAGKLNADKIKIVNAHSQAQMAECIKNMLSEEELNIYRRGKNARQKSMAKNQSMADYHKASGLEALIGYLYLKGNDKRIEELLDKVLGVDKGEPCVIKC